MASQSEILQSCLQEAARSARPALERCIEEAISGFQIAEGLPEKGTTREELGTAYRELIRHKATWIAQYPADLLALFKANVAAAARAAREQEQEGWGSADGASGAPLSDSTLARLSMDSFSLVDDAAISHEIESSRMMQQVGPVVENVLAQLNTLISTVQGLPNVRPDLNPLRPEVFTQALKEMITAAPVDAAITVLWLRALANPLGRELKRLYERIVELLETAKVQGASYRVLPTRSRGTDSASGFGSLSGFGPPSGYGSPSAYGTSGMGELAPGAGNSAFGRLGGGAQVPHYADLSNYEIRHELFQDFLFNGGSNANHSLAPSYYETVERELTALREAPDSGQVPLTEPPPEYQRMPAVDRPVRLVDERTQLSQEVWGEYGRPRARALVRTELKKEAKQVGQVLGLEVVRKLVNQVAQDPRLLVPVREAIVALEPSLLRLAMVDPRFFSDEGHAGRLIMERVAQRSFKYNDEYSAEFLAFFEPVINSFNELNAGAIESTEPFSLALAKLEYDWDEQDQLESEDRDNVMQALRFAEERQACADQIAYDLSQRSDLDQVPGLILDFLFGPWALAMAHAQLMDTRKQLDPMGLKSVVPDLLWSVKKSFTLKHPGKLIEMIPGLLAKLHAGLELLGQDPRESAPFFESLMKLHRPVLKLRRMRSQLDSEESGSMPLEPDEPPATPEQRLAKAAAHPWLGRDDLDAAGFEDTMPSEAGELTPMHDPEAAAAVRASAVPGIDAHALDQAGADEADAPTGAAISPEQATELLLSLQTGCWVDLYSKRRWLRAQLIWASTKATLFMFVSHGGQPHSMTKRSCERLIRDRLLRPVDSQGVISQALDVVVSEAAAAKANAASSRTLEPQPA